MFTKLKSKLIPSNALLANLLQGSNKTNNKNIFQKIKCSKISYSFNANNNAVGTKFNFCLQKNKNYSAFKQQTQNNSVYKISKRYLMDKDYSHLHIESTDKIYPKIKKYEYDFDLEKTDPILNEFNFYYELEDWDEALNKGFCLLNLFETNTNAKIQTINLCLFLAEIFLKQEKYENAVILLLKAEKRLDLKLFKKLEEEGLYYKYSVKLSLLKGISALKKQKDKEGILHLKKALQVIEGQKLLENQGKNSSISIASDYLTISLLQAQILLKSKISDKYNAKIAESLDFFRKRQSSDFSLDSKRKLIDTILNHCEAIKKNFNENKNYIDLATDYLNVIEKTISEIRNKKTRDELYLRFNLIWMALQAQKLTEPKSFFNKMDKFNDILTKLDLDPKLIESSKFEIADLKNTLCYKFLQNTDNHNDYNAAEIYKTLLNNQFEILKILKNQSPNYHSDLIVDDNSLSGFLLGFWQVYGNVKINKMQRQIELIISSNKNKSNFWDDNLTKAFIDNLNYDFLYLKNNKIFEDLNQIIKGSLNDASEGKGLNKEFENKFNEEKSDKKLDEYKRLNEIDFNSIKDTSGFIQREKLKSLSRGVTENLKSLNRVSKFMVKELGLLIRNSTTKNDTEDKFNILLLKCLLFDNCKNKNITQIQKFNKEIQKFFVFKKNEKLEKTSKKLNRNMSLTDIKIEVFNLDQMLKSGFHADLIITPKSSLIDNYRVYSEEEIRKIVFSVLAISNSYFKLAEENYYKLHLLFNEKNYDANNYFKNLFVVRHNQAHKTINFYLNLSLQLVHFIFSSKNDSIKTLLNSPLAKDIELIAELKKLIVFNFIRKSYTALYFSNIDLRELLDILKGNRANLENLLADGDSGKFGIKNEFERLEDITKKNLNG